MERSMKALEQTLLFLFPTAQLSGAEGAHGWATRQFQSFIQVSRFFFLSVAAGYLSHYFLFDRVLELEPIETWFRFRMATVAICVACFAYYCSPYVHPKAYKIPAAFCALVLCYSQSRVTVWYPEAPWIYCFVFVLACSMLLRTTPLLSLMFATVALALQIPSLLESGLESSEIFSAAFVTVGIICVVRASYNSELRNFVLNEENIQAQERVIELTQEYSNRVSSFIPRVIAKRLQYKVDQEQISTFEASLEVLRPQRREISCIFSDIRGFTQGSRDLTHFVDQSVIPEVRRCSDIVEDHEGIPRKIGDLVFAYFDDTSLPLNVIRAVMAAMKIARSNADMNATLGSIEVKRHILVASGEAIVGNIGGLDSSVEITALGNPVNYLSRLDEATKRSKLAAQLLPGDLVVCDKTLEVLKSLRLELDYRSIDLFALDIEIRDFSDQKQIFVLSTTDYNFETMIGLLKYTETAKAASS